MPESVGKEPGHVCKPSVKCWQCECGSFVDGPEHEYALIARLAALEVENARLREIVGQVHDALGEDRASEDSNLGECVGELRDAIAELRKRVAAAEALLARVGRALGYRMDEEAGFRRCRDP